MMEYLGKLIVINNLFYLFAILIVFAVIWELAHSLIFLLRCLPTFSAIKTLRKYQKSNIYQKYETLYPNIAWIKKYLAGREEGKIYNVKIMDNRFVLLDYPNVLQSEASLSKIKRSRMICMISGWIIVIYQLIFIAGRIYNRFYSHVGEKPTDKQLINFLFFLIKNSLFKIVPMLLLCVICYFLLTIIFGFAEFLRSKLRLIISRKLDELIVIQLRSNYNYSGSDED